MYEYEAEIIGIVDGDTVDAKIDLGFRMSTTQRLRLSGIDTPELKGPDKEKGISAMHYLSMRLLGRKVTILTEKSDSFGRYLATILLFDSDNNVEVVNDTLIVLGYAKEYKR